MSDAAKLAISQSFATHGARIIDNETLWSFIEAYNLYMKNRIDNGATDAEKEIMKSELSAIYTTVGACYKIKNWLEE